MRNSVLRRRFLSVVILGILVAALLTYVFYSVTANIVFRNVTARAFRDNASYLAAQTEQYMVQQLSVLRYDDIVSTSAQMTGATVTIFLFTDPPSYVEKSSSQADYSEAFMQYARTRMIGLQTDIQAGKSVDFVLSGENRNDAMLVVGYPVTVSDPYSGTANVSAGVFLMKPMSEIRAAYTSLNFALILSSCVAFLLMILPVVLIANRIIHPINQIHAVTTAMSQGNFTLRANMQQKGEIGELARAINQLASDLNLTISALLLEKNRLQQLLDGLNEGIFAVDSEFRITHINPAIYKLMGMQWTDTPETAPGTEEDRREALRELLPANVRRDYQAVLAEGRHRQRVICVRNRILFIQIEALQNSANEAVGAVGVFRDITESEKLEQTRRDYVANISHELKTPLTAMRALIEPLQDGMVRQESDRQRYYGIILNESIRLTRLIDDMLELSRIQAGQIQLEKMTFDLAEVTGALHDKYGEMCRKANIRLLFSPDIEHLQPLFSNPDRIEQILVILLDNALKFTPAGGTIEVGAREIRQTLEISVRDTGEGIAETDCEHIFERFYKVDKARGKSGTGLGLSIASEIVRLLGGAIRVKSRPGEGSTFTFTIPNGKSPGTGT